MTAADRRARALRKRQLGLVLAILLFATWIALAFLIPLAWAAILAIAEWPLYRRAISRFPGYDVLLAMLFALATALIVLIPLSVAAVSMAQESQAALDWVRHVQQSGIAPPLWLSSVPLVGPRAADYWQQHVGTPQAANALFGSVSASSVFAWTRSIGGEVAREMGLFLITLVALVSLLSHGKRIGTDAAVAAARTFGPFGGEFLERMIAAVRGTVNGTVLVSFGEGAIIGIGYVAAGVPQPLLFTLFTMLLALVPFGAWLAFGFASLILIGGGQLLAGGLLFAFGVTVMTVGDNVVQPAVIGGAVKLPFLLALIGAFGGLAEMGLVGLFIGPVVMAALLLVWREWIRPNVEQGDI
jgi:predicted PurR-regulated permease PerM